MTETVEVRCPLGEKGCTLREAFGTCEVVRTDWRWCQGYMAMVCPAALEAWKVAKEPHLTDDEIRAHVGTRRAGDQGRPEAPEQRGRPPDGALATVSGGLAACWQVYAPHEEGPAGFWDGAQREVLAVVVGVAALWKPGAPVDVVPNLVFLGHNGTGKTLLARLVARLAWDAGFNARFVDFTTMLKGAKATHAEHNEQTEAEYLAPWLEADLLVLDDVRPVFNSQDDENIATAVLAHRYGEREAERRRPTIVTSQLSRSALQDVIGSSAMRRLMDDGAARLLVFDWPAYRRTEPEPSPWWQQPLAVFDVETTGPNPQEDRMVQAAFALIHPKPDGGELGAAYSRSWLVDPGIPIPAEATAVHGITDQMVHDKGQPPAEVVAALAKRFNRAAELGLPVAVFNAAFDWTLMQAEAERHDVQLYQGVTLLDPLVLDRRVDKYRKGKRQLDDVCARYDVKREGAGHDALADAVAAGRLLLEIVRRSPDLQRCSFEQLREIQGESYDEWIEDARKYWEKTGQTAKLESLRTDTNRNPWRG